LPAFEEDALSSEITLTGAEADPGVLPTTRKLSLRLEGVEAMPCYVSQSTNKMAPCPIVVDRSPEFLLASHIRSMPPVISQYWSKTAGVSIVELAVCSMRIVCAHSLD
jgi:hypothetical protein